MSVERFDIGEEDFTNLCVALTYKIDVSLPQKSGEEAKKLTYEINAKLERAYAFLQQMEVEAHDAPMPHRSEMLTKLKMYREEAAKLSAKMHRSMEPSQATARKLLFASTPGTSVDKDTRRLVLQGTNALRQTADSIARSHQYAAETEEVGHEILDELESQRESLLRSKRRVEDTNVELVTSRNVLRTMYRRVITNKIMLSCIIACLILILVLVVYFKFFR